MLKFFAILEPAAVEDNVRFWRPLLIFIPLRLGVSDINPMYLSGLKVSIV